MLKHYLIDANVIGYIAIVVLAIWGVLYGRLTMKDTRDKY